MRRLLRVFLVVLAVLLVLVGVALVRAMTVESRQISLPPAEALAFDADRAAENLAALIRIRTVSTQGGALDQLAFDALHAELTTRYPNVHRSLQREVVAGASLLYTWPGADPNAPALLFLAHQDVVPVVDPSAWTQPPYAGVRAGGFVWGRGAMDDKGCIVAILEAVEALLVAGFQPAQTVYLAFGHDEEIGGKGAEALARTLAERKANVGFVLDEGGAIVDGVVPGLTQPAALVGISEKGYVSLELKAKGAGGHASMPPKTSAAGRVAAAAHRVEQAPFEMHIGEVSEHFMDWLAPEMPLGQRLGLANRWLMAPVLKSIYDKKPSTAASLRTTTAVTMLRGSPKANVLPQQAAAVINFRILPGETRASVQARVEALVDDDQITITALPFSAEPSPISSPEGEGFERLQRALAQTRPDVVVAPFLTVGLTDARYYTGLSDQVFRLAPFMMNDADLKRIHGVDERVSEADLATAIRFYAALIRGT